MHGESVIGKVKESPKTPYRSYKEAFYRAVRMVPLFVVCGVKSLEPTGLVLLIIGIIAVLLLLI